MQRKAQNLIEVALLICVTLVVGLSTWAIYNNQKTHLATLSKTSNAGGPVAANQAFNPNDKIKYNAVETAGSNALTSLKMTAAQYNLYMSNITAGTLKAALEGTESDPGLAELANKIIADSGLTCAPISADNISMDTLTTLTSVMNKVSDSKYSGDKSVSDSYVAKLKVLLTTVGGSLKL